MSRESFLVYKSFYEPIRQLSDEDFGKIFKAVFEYQIEGKKPEISPLLMMAFSFIKDALDRDNLKYQMIVERNSNNGRNGGRPKKEPKKPSRLFGNPKNPKNPSEADTDNDTVNVNKYVYSSFYDNQIELSENNPDYIKFVKYIYGGNDIEKRLNRVLGLKDQLSYIQFEKLLTKSIEKNKKLRDMLLDLENNVAYTKGRSNLYSIFNSWLNRG